MGRTVGADIAMMDAEILTTDAMRSMDSCADCIDMGSENTPTITVQFLSPVDGTTLPLGATVVLTGQIVITGDYDLPCQNHSGTEWQRCAIHWG